MGNKWNKYLEIEKHDSIAKMVLHTIDKFGYRTCMRWWLDEECTKFDSITYNELKDRFMSVFGGLCSLGYKRHDHIAICSETRPEWVITDLGIQSLGASTTAIYPSLKPKEMLYILKDSETEAIFVDEEEILEKILSINKDLPNLKNIFIFELDFDKIEKYKSNNVMILEDLMNLGRKFNAEHPEKFMECVNAVEEEDLASLIYTSGTTGIPKGTMLTNKNFLSMAFMADSVVGTMLGDIKPEEMDFLCILPMSHSFGRGCDEYCVLMVGACMNFAGGFNPFKVRKSFETFKPTILLAVPYFFQKIYNMVQEEVQAMPPTVQKVFSSAINAGKEYYTNKRFFRKNSMGTKIKFNTLTKLVGKIVRKKLGGRMVGMISGSAALAPELMIFFTTVGITIGEGYGLTETSPVTHLLRTEANSDYRIDCNKKIEPYSKIGMIGPTIMVPNSPYEPMEQKLSEIGELLLKGPQITKGYWNLPEHTAAAIDEDGWFHTGDLAEIDEDGYAKIVGRAKLVIKLQTAKMISPAAVETLIVPISRIVAQFILVGDDTRKYLTALVVPYQEPLKKYANDNNIPYNSWQELINNRKILNLIKDDILKLTEDISDYARPKKFAISSAAFTAEEGYITPSFKFKRNKIFTDLKDVIDKLYEIEDDFLVIDERLTDFYDQSLIIG